MNISVCEIIDRIKRLRPIKDLEEIGISSSVVSNWKIRETIPRADDLYKISKFLGISMEYLLTGESTTDNFDTPEKKLFEKINKLESKQKKALEVIIDAML